MRDWVVGIAASVFVCAAGLFLAFATQPGHDRLMKDAMQQIRVTRSHPVCLPQFRVPICIDDVLRLREWVRGVPNRHYPLLRPTRPLLIERL